MKLHLHKYDINSCDIILVGIFNSTKQQFEPVKWCEKVDGCRVGRLSELTFILYFFISFYCKSLVQYLNHNKFESNAWRTSVSIICHECGPFFQIGRPVLESKV